MRRQEYPEKAPYHSWKFVNNGGETIEEQLQKWYNEHPYYAITNHLYSFQGNDNGYGIEFLEVKYFDLEEAEKDIDPEFRTPPNNYYFKKIIEPLESGFSNKFEEWYQNNDVDIISVSTYLDTKNLQLVNGYIYVDRKEAKDAYDLKYERQQKQIQKMSEEMAKKQINKETEKRLK